MFRTVSQVMINYRHSPLSSGTSGELHGGDRLPWVAVDGVDNYHPLASPVWQVHVYGNTTADLMVWRREHDLPLHVFPWHSAYGEAGFAENGVYLLRPDTYIALADRSTLTTVTVLSRYLADRDLRL